MNFPFHKDIVIILSLKSIIVIIVFYKVFSDKYILKGVDIQKIKKK